MKLKALLLIEKKMYQDYLMQYIREEEMFSFVSKECEKVAHTF